MAAAAVVKIVVLTNSDTHQSLYRDDEKEEGQMSIRERDWEVRIFF